MERFKLFQVQFVQLLYTLQLKQLDQQEQTYHLISLLLFFEDQCFFFDSDFPLKNTWDKLTSGYVSSDQKHESHHCGSSYGSVENIFV